MPGTQGEDEAMRETTALRIGAGLDAMTVSGLTGDERAEVIESWARCGVEAVEPPARADAHRDADPARPWLQSTRTWCAWRPRRRSSPPAAPT